jgi:hypothetical protein
MNVSTSIGLRPYRKPEFQSPHGGRTTTKSGHTAVANACRQLGSPRCIGRWRQVQRNPTTKEYFNLATGLPAERLVRLQGAGHWGGHWAARLGYVERSRLKGVVVQGGPVHAYFQPEWQRKALGTREYLFELFEARASIYGASTLDDFLAYGPKMSFVTSGLVNQPSAPMLLINGLRDTQVPAEDVFLLMRSGSPKEVWFNPEGGHMGRTVEFNDRKIFDTVTLPWVVRTLKSN